MKWTFFIIDELHIAIPQLGGMYKEDKTRKKLLINFELAIELREKLFKLQEKHQKP